MYPTYECLKRTLTDLEGEIKSNTITVGDVITPPYINRWTIHIGIKGHFRPDGLNRYMYRTFHSKAAYSSHVHKEDSPRYMLGHKISLNKFEKILSSIFSGHSDMKLELNHKMKTKKITNTWRLNNATERSVSQ